MGGERSGSRRVTKGRDGRGGGKRRELTRGKTGAALTGMDRGSVATGDERPSRQGRGCPTRQPTASGGRVTKRSGRGESASSPYGGRCHSGSTRSQRGRVGWPSSARPVCQGERCMHAPACPQQRPTPSLGRRQPCTGLSLGQPKVNTHHRLTRGIVDCMLFTYSEIVRQFHVTLVAASSSDSPKYYIIKL